MAKKKTVTPSSTSNSSSSSTAQRAKGPAGDDDPLPFSQYVPLTIIHSLLLLFSMLVLPRTTLMFRELPPQTSSVDRPQAEFMAPITAWPAISVLWMCAGAAISQIYWSHKAAGWIKNDFIKDTGADKEEVTLLQGDRSLESSLKAWGVTFMAAACFHIVIIILGAPMSSYILHTFLLALLVAILSAYGPARSLALPSFSSTNEADVKLRTRWTRIFTNFNAKTRAERAILYPAIAAMFGAWCGAYPLALDWDRPWQAWPLTPAMGAILGYTLGSFNSVFVSGVYYLARTLPDPSRIDRKTQ